ncbi:hypothetical protein BESB_003460 [Besnoitia besnoiti]|uniref:Uncharacterized protein n=1 Tax=Besnoitia besnoiti TaxID=94643 RepID=A0A2A9MJ58_BESBE|nr:hypothetical protein BESB_003460 [Besnoitia besnoiti]PFH38005.1 hypothetical protein BESB_003460 [Besnoitia besnoiti]
MADAASLAEGFPRAAGDKAARQAPPATAGLDLKAASGPLSYKAVAARAVSQIRGVGAPRSAHSDSEESESRGRRFLSPVPAAGVLAQPGDEKERIGCERSGGAAGKTGGAPSSRGNGCRPKNVRTAQSASPHPAKKTREAADSFAFGGDADRDLLGGRRPARSG